MSSPEAFDRKGVGHLGLAYEALAAAMRDGVSAKDFRWFMRQARRHRKEARQAFETGRYLRDVYRRTAFSGMAAKP